MASAMGMSFLEFLVGDAYNSLGKINKLKSKILIIHGDEDGVVPYKMGKKIFDKYTGKKKMITIVGGTHNGLQDKNPNLYWGEIELFLQ